MSYIFGPERGDLHTFTPLPSYDKASAFRKLTVKSGSPNQYPYNSSRTSDPSKQIERKQRGANQTEHLGPARAALPRAKVHRRMLRSAAGPGGNLKASLSVALPLPAPVSRHFRHHSTPVLDPATN